MKRLFLLAITIFLALAVAQAQSVAPAVKSAKPWTQPKTPEGVPDFQGVWTNNTVTPFQRAKELGSKETYTEAEYAEVIKKEQSRANRAEEEGRGTEAGTADDVHYDFAQFGLDRAQTKMAWDRRTSIISGPEGRIPELTPEARKRAAERAALNKGHEFDGPENRPLGARCLARENVGPPLLPTAYNSNLQIVQGPGYVVIEAEMIHDARMIPTDGRPHIAPTVKQWMGDSVGHWEGNTLVIDTTNFTDKAPFAGAQNLHVIERLTRADESTILYQFTVEDAGQWVKPWSGELAMAKMQGPLYEYACHEANYGLVNTLKGARVAEQEAAKKAAK